MGDSQNAQVGTGRRSTGVFDVLFWVPPWSRWNPDSPPRFTIWHNILFAFAGAFTVANLYYCQPILNVLAKDFDTSQEGVSKLPTLVQAGYATGLLLVLPLGDLLPRRRLTLTCIFVTATMWIGLCITKSFISFIVISFLTSITTVTPQIMLPLVAELASEKHRAFSLAIVGSGNALGLAIARILAGTVTNYTSWRNIYWLALGLQYLILTLLFLFMPDYPSKNQHKAGQIPREYARALWSILKMPFKYPVLVQAGLIAFTSAVPYTDYWTTLSFLLAGSPYNYSSVVIGLFGLIGLAVVALNPVYGRYLIAPLRVPHYSIMVAQSINLAGAIIGTYAGKYTVAAVIIQAFTLDSALQVVQISNRIAIHSVEPNGRNRVNTVFMLFSFCGQLTGTAAGNRLYGQYGGWVASGSLSVAILAFCFVVIVARGPYEERWIGWKGGWGRRPKGWKADAVAEEDHESKDESVGDVQDVEKETRPRSMELQLALVRTVSSHTGRA